MLGGLCRRRGGVVKVIEPAPRKALAELALDAGELLTLLRRNQYESIARVAGAPGSADAVDVLVRGGGYVEVHDVCDMADIEAAGRDVRCYQHGEGTVAEALHRSLPLGRAAVGMQFLNLMP